MEYHYLKLCIWVCLFGFFFFGESISFFCSFFLVRWWVVSWSVKGLFLVSHLSVSVLSSLDFFYRPPLLSVENESTFLCKNCMWFTVFSLLLYIMSLNTVELNLTLFNWQLSIFKTLLLCSCHDDFVTWC